MTTEPLRDERRPHRRDERRTNRWTATSVALGGGAALCAAFVLSPSGIESGPELCPFRRVTGLPCPGCGLTRSWVYLAHGDVGRAFEFNVFGPVIFLVTAIAVVVGVFALVKADGTPLNRLRRVLTGPVGVVLLVTWLAYGAVRLVDDWQGWGIFPHIA